METREQLLKEHTEWTVKYVKAHERVVSLLPPCKEIREGEEPPVWIPTMESLAEFESAKKDEETALAKLREIMEKLSQIR